MEDLSLIAFSSDSFLPWNDHNNGNGNGNGKKKDNWMTDFIKRMSPKKIEEEIQKTRNTTQLVSEMDNLDATITTSKIQASLRQRKVKLQFMESSIQMDKAELELLKSYQKIKAEKERYENEMFAKKRKISISKLEDLLAEADDDFDEPEVIQ